MKSKFRKFIGETRGIAAIEIAFIMPFMLLIYFGLFDITSLVSMNRKVTYSASIVADLVAQNKTSVLKSQHPELLQRRQYGHGADSASAVRVEVFGYRIAGSTISQIWKTNNGQASSCGAAPVHDRHGPAHGGGKRSRDCARLHDLRSLCRELSWPQHRECARHFNWRKHYATAAQHTETDLL